MGKLEMPAYTPAPKSLSGQIRQAEKMGRESSKVVNKEKRLKVVKENARIEKKFNEYLKRISAGYNKDN
jgi:hypothetical protein